MKSSAKTILVIDGHEESLLSVTALLAGMDPGVATLSSASGAEGIELAKTHRPDGILLDIPATGPDRFAVCETLKNEKSLSGIPVVFIIPRDETRENKFRALEAGADGFLAKPVDEPELAAILKTLFRIKDPGHLSLADDERLEQRVAERIKELQEDLQRNLDLAKRTSDSEKRFRLVQDISPDGFTVLHPVRNEKGEVVDFTWVYENPAIARINGTHPEEVVGKRVLDLFPNHRGTSVFQVYVEVANAGNSQVINEVFVGEIVSVPTWLRLVVVAIGEVIAILAQNITAQKRVEEALKKSEEQYRLLFENSSEVIYVAQDGRIVFHNPRIQTISGYSSEEILSKPFIEFTYEDDREVILDHHFRILRGESDPTSIVVRIISKTGRILFVEINPVLIEWNGKPATLNFLSDVTERKHAEDKLRKLSQAVEQSPASVVITNPAGTIEYVNTKFSALTGYNLDEAIGHNPRILKSGKQTDGFYKHLWNTISSGKEWKGEFHNVNKNGELYWESALISPILNEKGEIINYLGIKEDITEQKRFEEDLNIAKNRVEESEEKYRTLIATMMNAFALHEMIFDDDGEPTDYRILEVNPAWEKTVGIKAENVLGRSIKEVMPDIEPVWIQLYGRVVKTGIAEDFTEFNAATGKYYHVNAYRPSEGKFAVFFNDITKRMQAEEALRASEERFSTIFRTSPVAIAVSRMHDHVLMDVNEAWEEITGYSRKEAIGHPASELQLWVDPANRQRMVDSLHTRATAKSEEKIKGKTGGISDVLMVATKINLSGEEYLLSMAQNITDRKQAEAQIRSQLDELVRWQEVMLGREDRVQELKREVNDLCRALGQPPQYPSQEPLPEDPAQTNPVP